jgi:hypothetical protein
MATERLGSELDQVQELEEDEERNNKIYNTNADV